MIEREFDEIAGLCQELGGLSISLPGDGEHDEIRVTCVDEPGGGWRANYARRRSDGTLVFGGRDGCAFGTDAATALSKAIGNAIGADAVDGAMRLQLNGARSLWNPSRAELYGGTEPWDAYDYGKDEI